ncbi:MAG TPA: hypothetical protein ENN64_00270, partial [bacterium]|nr:hypothetical protein [bacterium]
MIKLNWQKLNEQKKEYLKNIKPKTFIVAMSEIDDETLKKIAKDEKETYIWGAVEEEWFDGLENSEHFRPLSEQKIENKLNKNFPDSANHAILSYQKSNLKYLISELKPEKIIWIYGTWSRVLHYWEEWWKGYE